VKDAIDAGYRHIDTAFVYENEKSVGEAINEKIAEGVVKREEIFVVTKLWVTHFDRVEEACKNSLEKLGLEYIDLYLIHAPISAKYVDETTFFPKKENGELDILDYDHLLVWKQMEKCVENGWVRSIGVSNFNSQQVENIVKNCKIKPVCNQVECSPVANQKKLALFCKNLGIQLTGYSPLGQNIDPEKKTPRALFDEKVKKIAEKYQKTPAQIILRFVYELGVIPIAKSSNKGRIVENISIFDFKLNDEELEYLSTFDNFNERVVKLEVSKNSKYYPFNTEF
jgi:aldehyde reductase